jgi:dipeptide/tripeptide permease
MASTEKMAHPRGLYTLFFTEMWERFSYYVMRALLVLYLTTEYLRGGFGILTEALAARIRAGGGEIRLGVPC